MTKPIRFTDIDILRWIAILLMIASHFGAQLVTEEIRSMQPFYALNFAGGWAPVLFFFVTGLGYGVNSVKPLKDGYWFDALSKALILFLVERVTFFLSGNFFGIDFLSFIALIIIILSVFRFYRINTWVILGLMMVLLFIRYFIGPVLQGSGISNVSGFLLGVNGIAGYSYPFTPWLLYPFAGYVIGNILAIQQLDMKTFCSKYRTISLIGFVFVLVLLLINGWLRGYVLFRWGTVSLDYFLLSVLALLFFFHLSTLFPSKLHSYCSIAGLSSLLVVPIHYYLIDTGIFVVTSSQLIAFLALCLLIIISILLANIVSGLISKIGQHQERAAYAVFVVVMVLLAVYIISDGGVYLLTRSLLLLLQLSICSFFVLGLRWMIPKGI